VFNRTPAVSIANRLARQSTLLALLRWLIRWNEAKIRHRRRTIHWTAVSGWRRTRSTPCCATETTKRPIQTSTVDISALWRTSGIRLTKSGRCRSRISSTARTVSTSVSRSLLQTRLAQARVSGRSFSVTSPVNTIFWKRINRFSDANLHGAKARNNQLWGSGGERSRSYETEAVS